MTSSLVAKMETAGTPLARWALELALASLEAKTQRTVLIIMTHTALWQLWLGRRVSSLPDTLCCCLVHFLDLRRAVVRRCRVLWRSLE